MDQHLLSYLIDKLDTKSSTPLYLQLKNALKSAIDEKLLAHGNVLPSERKLSLALGVSRVTVVKALAELLDQGLVIKNRGKGTVVNLPVHYNLSGGGFSSQLQHQGQVSNRWLVRELQPLCGDLMKELELSEEQMMAKIKRVRLVDDLPVSIETTYIPETFLPRPDLLDGSLYAHWKEQGIEPDIQEYSLTTYAATDDEARMLEIPVGSQLMKVVLKSRDKKGKVLEYGSAICRSDFYHFEFRVRINS
ncbi:GntR family transcriptional regulator [Vibrio mimicus]